MGSLEEVDMELDRPLLWQGMMLYRDPNLGFLYLAVGNAELGQHPKNRSMGGHQ